jgi:hypothetical protein
MSSNVLRSCALLVGFAGCALSSTALGDVIVSGRYDSLAGSYDMGLQMFTAAAVNTAALQTSGAVTRLVAPSSTAVFQAGFVAAADPANFAVNVTAIPTANPNRRTGTGTFSTIDVDGDEIVGTVAGTWINGGPGFIFFNGTLSNVVINPAGSGVENASFDGTASGSFGFNLGAATPYEGAIVQLVFGAPSFFTQGFDGRATGVTFQLVPAPGAVALMGLGALAAFRRRR